MQARNAASVFPEPVGAEMRVAFPARMCGQPCCCGSRGVPNLLTNHSPTMGGAHSRPVSETRSGLRSFPRKSRDPAEGRGAVLDTIAGVMIHGLQFRAPV